MHCQRLILHVSFFFFSFFPFFFPQYFGAYPWTKGIKLAGFAPGTLGGWFQAKFFWGHHPLLGKNNSNFPYKKPTKFMAQRLKAQVS